MSYPDIFAKVTGTGLLTQALGQDPVRFFPFGQAPTGVADPYAVWQVVGGAPENYLDVAPDVDSFLIQIDVYGMAADRVRAAAAVLRDAIELHAQLAAWRGESQDRETKRFRVSFDVNWWQQRS